MQLPLQSGFSNQHVGTGVTNINNNASIIGTGTIGTLSVTNNASIGGTFRGLSGAATFWLSGTLVLPTMHPVKDLCSWHQWPCLMPTATLSRSGSSTNTFTGVTDILINNVFHYRHRNNVAHCQ
jgi:hypothetical protein